MNQEWSQAQTDIGNDLAESDRRQVTAHDAYTLYCLEDAIRQACGEHSLIGDIPDRDQRIDSAAMAAFSALNDRRPVPASVVLELFARQFARRFAPSEGDEGWAGSGADHAAWLYDMLHAFGIEPGDYVVDSAGERDHE